MPIPRVSVYIATSLDGFIAGEDGALDWLESVQVPGEDYGYAAFLATVDGVVLGRRTFEQIRTFDTWPFPGLRTAVLTHRPLPPQAPVEAWHGALRPRLERWAREGIRHVYLDGGEAIRQGLAEGCVAHLTLSRLPILLGTGRPLFAPPSPRLAWTHEGTEAFPSGLVQSRYRALDGRPGRPEVEAQFVSPS